MKKFSDSPRIDLICYDKAVEQGWTPKFDWRDKTHNRTTPENCPHYPISYKKGAVMAWKQVNRYTLEPYFKVADLIDDSGGCCNHRNYDNFDQILENENNF